MRAVLGVVQDHELAAGGRQGVARAFGLVLGSPGGTLTISIHGLSACASSAASVS